MGNAVIFRKSASSEPKIPFGFHGTIHQAKENMSVKDDITAGSADLKAEYDSAEPVEKLFVIVFGTIIGLVAAVVIVSLLWALAKFLLPFVAVGMIGWCMYRWWKGLPLFPAGKISFKKK